MYLFGLVGDCTYLGELVTVPIWVSLAECTYLGVRLAMGSDLGD